MEDLLRNLYGMQPGYVISNFKQVNSYSSLRQLQLQYSMFIEIRNKRICVCSYLSRKYSVLFSLVDCLKVKCDVVFLKIHEECKTNVMWSSIVVVFSSEEHWLSFPE